MATRLVDRTTGQLRQLVSDCRRAGLTQLPPEVELSAKFGVGRSTLREALALLEFEGLIDRNRRRGTTLRPVPHPWGDCTPAYPVHLILALPDFLAEYGIAHEVRQFSVHLEEASSKTVGALELEPGAEVFRVDRLYEIDGVPGAHLRHYFPTVLNGEAVPIGSFNSGATNFLEEEQGFRLTDTESIVKAEPAGQHLAGVLALDIGAPVLAMCARLIAGDLGPVALGQMAFNPEVFSLSVRAFAELRPNAG